MSTTSERPFQFDTFIFDLDGTILHTLPDLVVLTNTALREFGYPERTEAEILSFVGNGVRALMLQAVPENTSDADAEKAVERWEELYPVLDNQLTQPFAGVVETLTELQNRCCKLGVVSNKFDHGVHIVLEKFLPGFFEVQYGECEEAPRKPNPTGLLRAISELGSTPERTVYIGDSPGDIITARNAGTYAVGVSWGYHAVEDFAAADAEPDLMIDSMEQLLDLAGYVCPHC